MKSKLKPKRNFLHTLFEASVIIKAINGTWETISGLGLLLFSHVTVAHAFSGIAKHDMTRGTQDFAGIYILSHGVVNIFLAYYLYKQKLWAFWVSISFFGASMLYLGYRAMNHPSLILYWLILFDAICIYLTIHEYNYRKTLAATAK